MFHHPSAVDRSLRIRRHVGRIRRSRRRPAARAGEHVRSVGMRATDRKFIELGTRNSKVLFR
eukprot:9285100-Pyramimonas_sp.AAC.1